MFKNPLVVGYKGEIGSFILQGLLKKMPKANNILCTDKNNTEKETIERIKKSDVIFLCVPIECTPCWLDQYRKHLKGKLIVEQTSLKSYMFGCHCECMKGLKVISMHLLFKPSATPNSKDMRWAVVESEHPKWGELIDLISLITEGAECLIYNDVDDHDRDMAKQQALLHRIILSIDKFLGDSGRTYIGLKIGELATRIKSMNPILFETIQGNKYIPEVIEQFEKEIKNAETFTKRPKISKKERC